MAECYSGQEWSLAHLGLVRWGNSIGGLGLMQIKRGIHGGGSSGKETVLSVGFIGRQGILKENKACCKIIYFYIF